MGQACAHALQTSCFFQFRGFPSSVVVCLSDNAQWISPLSICPFLPWTHGNIFAFTTPLARYSRVMLPCAFLAILNMACSSFIYWTSLKRLSIPIYPAFPCHSRFCTRHTTPKSLPQAEMFWLPVVPHMEATLCFWLSLLPSSECFWFSNNGWFSSQGVQECAHCPYIHICSLRWTINLNSGIVTCSLLRSFPNSKCFLRFFTAIEHWLVTLRNQLLWPPVLALVMASSGPSFPA